MPRKTKAQRRKEFYTKIGAEGGKAVGAVKARGNSEYYAKLAGLRKTRRGGKSTPTS